MEIGNQPPMLDQDSLLQPPPPQPPPVPVSPEFGKPWGFWITLWLGLLLWAGWVAVQMFSGGIFIFVEMIKVGFDPKNLQKVMENIQFDGLMIGVTSVVSIPFLVGGCWLFAAMRTKYGVSVREYLALRPMGWKSWIFWPIACYGVMFLMGNLLVALGAPEVNPWMKEMAEKVSNFWWLAIAVIICAPILEEFLFRGFLFKGWMHSKLGIPGTILLTTFLWTIIHLQYDIWALVAVGTLGIILGTARVVSKSLWAPIWIHFVNNAVASIEIYRISSGG